MGVVGAGRLSSHAAIGERGHGDFIALEEQLGLKLEPATKRLPTVVIDHIVPPTEN